jgi:hypothetical protein
LLYLGLAAIGLIGTVVTYWRSDRKAELLILLAFSAAVILIADWIAYGVFGLYDYSPGLVADNIADSALGEFLAEAVFVPSLVVMLISWLPGLAGMVVGTAVVAGLEVLLGSLGLYHCAGWVLWCTIAGFAVYFAALDLFWHDMIHRTYPFGRVRLFLRAALVFDSLALLTLLLRGQQWVVTHLDIMPTYIENQALGRFITYPLIAGPAGYWVLCGQGTGRWVRLGLVMAGLAALDFGLTALNMQHFVAPYSWFVDVLAQGAGFSLAALSEDAIMAQYRRQHRRLA